MCAETSRSRLDRLYNEQYFLSVDYDHAKERIRRLTGMMMSDPLAAEKIQALEEVQRQREIRQQELIREIISLGGTPSYDL